MPAGDRGKNGKASVDPTRHLRTMRTRDESLREAASIGDYGLLGDTRTAALISPRGSIDWMCLPRFDSDPVFGYLVDRERGGRFAIDVPAGEITSLGYRERTATIETTFRGADGEAVLADGFVLDVSSRLLPQTLLVRALRCTRGRVVARVFFDPRPGLPGRPMRTARRAGAIVATSASLALALVTEPSLPLEPGRACEVELGAGETLTASLCATHREPLVFVRPAHAAELVDEADRWWRRWCEDVRYEGPLRGAVERSLITLRLLTYAPSGAPVAAPTTSIGAPPGSDRAWDYRYSWPRDASFGIDAFLALHGVDEPRSFLRWLVIATKTTRPRVEVLYTLDGRSASRETVVEGITGHAGSPVRIGNDARTQHQLDAYGWVVDAAWMMVRAGHLLDRETWRAMARFADFAGDHWSEPDAGLWEVRGSPRSYVHSKAMAWVALDRALRIAEVQGVKAARARRWRERLDEIAADVLAHGFDPERGTYLRSYGSNEVDAASLLLPVLGFGEENPARAEGTIEAVRTSLGAGGPLLYRYPPGSDGLEGEESAFVVCTFWLVQALVATGRLDEAEEVMEEICPRATPLGLYAEQINPTTGVHEGNFPQALSHAGLLHAVSALSEARGSRRGSRRTRRAPQRSRPGSRARS